MELPASPSARNGEGRVPVGRPGAGPPDQAKGLGPASTLTLEDPGVLGERPPLPNKHRRRWSWSKNNGHSDAGARLTPDPRCTGRAEQTGVGSGCCWGARQGGAG